MAAAGGGGDAADEQLYPQYDAAHPLGVPLLVNVLACVAQAGYVVDAAQAFASCKAVWRRDVQVQWALAKQQRRRDKMTRLMRACDRGDLARVVELLAWRSDVDAQDADSWAPLHFASALGRLEVARELVARGGARLETRNARGKSALHLACSFGHAATARLLLDAGALVDGEDGECHTPLWCASALNQPLEIVRELLARGANVNAADDGNRTPLVIASKNGSAAIVRELISRGADLDAQTTVGRWSALMNACYQGSLGVAALLVNAGADTSLRHSHGTTALGFAIACVRRDDSDIAFGGAAPSDEEREEHLRLVALLEERGAP